MTNPLDRFTPQAPLGNQWFANMKVGETRTAMIPRQFDEKGKPDLSSLEAFTMTRTARPFIYDWVDCVSNEMLDRKKRRDVRWVVIGEHAHLVPQREAERLAKLR